MFLKKLPDLYEKYYIFKLIYNFENSICLPVASVDGTEDINNQPLEQEI